MAKNIIDLGTLESRVDGDGCTSRFQAAEAGKCEFRTVQKVNGYAVAGLQTGRK
jgi:hypothetical protein